jgi:alpha-methylacyl-CoA racemase
MDPSTWPAMKEKLSGVFRQKTQAQWCELLEGSDACFAPVLSMDEAPDHPHNRARAAFVELDGVRQPAPAPRFSRTQLAPPTPPEALGAADPRAVLAEWGIDPDAIQAARDAGLLG